MVAILTKLDFGAFATKKTFVFRALRRDVRTDLTRVLDIVSVPNGNVAMTNPSERKTARALSRQV